MKNISILLVFFAVGCSSIHQVNPATTHTMDVHRPEPVSEISPSGAWPNHQTDQESYEIEPWSGQNTRSEISNQALKKSHTFFSYAETKRFFYSLEVYSEATISKDQASCAQNSSKNMINMFDELLPEEFLDEQFYLILATTPEWAAENILNKNLDLPEISSSDSDLKISYGEWLGRAFSPGNQFGIGEDRAVLVGANGNLRTSCMWLGLVAAHETFHMVHTEIDGTSLANQMPGSYSGTPAWFYEGSAEFFAFSMQDYFEIMKYPEHNVANKSGALQDHEPADASIMVYDFGRLAIEYLVANVGVEPVINIFYEVGKGKPFEEAFETSVGISLQEFYFLFDRV